MRQMIEARAVHRANAELVQTIHKAKDDIRALSALARGLIAPLAGGANDHIPEDHLDEAVRIHRICDQVQEQLTNGLLGEIGHEAINCQLETLHEKSTNDFYDHHQRAEFRDQHERLELIRAALIEDRDILSRAQADADRLADLAGALREELEPELIRMRNHALDAYARSRRDSLEGDVDEILIES